MINEGNSLAELQARVLRASPHEMKSVTLSEVRLRHYPMDIVFQPQRLTPRHNTLVGAMAKAMAHKFDALMYATLLNSFSPKNSVQAVRVKATFAGTSRLAGGRANVIIIDDPHIT